MKKQKPDGQTEPNLTDEDQNVTPEQFVAQYRAKGYPDDRIRIVLKMRDPIFRCSVEELLDKAPSMDAPKAEVKMKEEYPFIEDMRARGESAVGRIVMISVDDCIPTPDNRPIDETAEKFQSLKSSIAKAGVQVPIIVRPHPTEANKFEICDGERRWRCARSMGPMAVHIKAEIRQMTNAQALALTTVTNLEREDLRPVDEGRLVARMMDEMAGNAEAVAKIIGHSSTWVRTRAHLRELIQPWKDAMEGGPTVHESATSAHFGAWTTAHWVQIARLPKEAQQRALNELSRIFDAGRWTPKTLERQLEGQQRLLSGAPWKLDDEALVRRAGSCCNCVKRTAAQGQLFYETMDPAKIKADDRCLDSGCWDRKDKAAAALRVAEAQRKHPDAISVSTSTRHFLGSLNAYQWHYSHGKEKGAVEAIQIDGPDAGKVVKVVPSAGALKSLSHDATEDTDQDRLVRMEEDHARRLENECVRAAIETLGSPTALKQPEDLNVLRLAAIVGVFVDDNSEEYRAKMSRARMPAVIATIWEGVREMAVQDQSEELMDMVLSYGGKPLSVIKSEVAKTLQEPDELRQLREKLAAAKPRKGKRDGKAAAAGEKEGDE